MLRPYGFHQMVSVLPGAVIFVTGKKQRQLVPIPSSKGKEKVTEDESAVYNSLTLPGPIFLTVNKHDLEHKKFATVRAPPP